MGEIFGVWKLSATQIYHLKFLPSSWTKEESTKSLWKVRVWTLYAFELALYIVHFNMYQLFNKCFTFIECITSCKIGLAIFLSWQLAHYKQTLSNNAWVCSFKHSLVRFEFCFDSIQYSIKINQRANLRDPTKVWKNN